jgi:hypothetical protein
MDELLKALGLPEGATEAEALDALSALQAKAGEVGTLTVMLAEANQMVEAKRAESEAKEAELNTVIDAHRNVREAAERTALEAQVELALTAATREGRATPATAATLREQVLGTEEAAGTLTLEGLKAMLETLPVMAQSVVNPPKKAADTTPEQQVLARAREIANKGVPMSKAITQATKEMNDVASQLVGNKR